MSKHFKMLLLIALGSSTLDACSQIPISDHIVYGDEGKFGADAVHTLLTSIAPVHYDKTTWDTMRIGMACLAVADLADIQASVDTLCTQHPGECDYQTQQTIEAARAAIRQVILRMEWEGIKVPDSIKDAFVARAYQ